MIDPLLSKSQLVFALQPNLRETVELDPNCNSQQKPRSTNGCPEVIIPNIAAIPICNNNKPDFCTEQPLAKLLLPYFYAGGMFNEHMKLHRFVWRSDIHSQTMFSI